MNSMQRNDAFKLGLQSIKIYKIIILAVVLIALISFPFISNSLFYIKLVTSMMIYGLLAMSLDFLLGYTGLLSFMHNAYLGISAYIVGIFLINIAPEALWLAILIGFLGTTIIAVPVGWIQVRTGGLAFALLTIAFGMMFYTLVWKLEITGGSDGLMGVPLPDLKIIGFDFGNLGDPRTMYLFSLAVLVICYIIAYRLVHSPFGAVLQAIRENEERASFIGYNVHRYKFYGWLISCGLASISGALFILYKGYIGPPTMTIFAGAGILMMVLLGGIRSLWGPIIGACIFIYIEDYISSLTVHWKTYVGLIVILLVLFLPRGIAGLSSFMQRTVKGT